MAASNKRVEDGPPLLTLRGSRGSHNEVSCTPDFKSDVDVPLMVEQTGERVNRQNENG
jgi:hypothetical protein